MGSLTSRWLHTIPREKKRYTNVQGSGTHLLIRVPSLSIRPFNGTLSCEFLQNPRRGTLTNVSSVVVLLD